MPTCTTCLYTNSRCNLEQLAQADESSCVILHMFHWAWGWLLGPVQY